MDTHIDDYATAAEREALGSLIWETSHRDEGSISATGASIVADAILAEFLPAHDGRVRAGQLEKIAASPVSRCANVGF